MIPYPTKSSKLPGTSYKQVYKNAQIVFKKIKHRTKRKPYIRSAYFNKEKIFFDYFWVHLNQKRRPERQRRRNHPESMQNPAKESELLHRFARLTKDKELFYIQIKEHKRTGRKQLMSIFPAK